MGWGEGGGVPVGWGGREYPSRRLGWEGGGEWAEGFQAV
jgi:hypothetical protein